MGTEMKYNYGRSLRIYGAGSDENKYYWYPFTGYKDCTTGEFKCVGEVAYYWTSYWEDRPYQSGYGSVLMLDAEDMSGDYQSSLFITSACGFPVRCAKDTYK